MQKKHRSERPALALSLLVLSGLAGAGWSPQAQACSTDDYTSTICVMAAFRIPSNYHVADGSTLQIRQYPALYSLIGTTFGGDGSTTFGLPNLQGRVIVGANGQKGASTTFPWGAQGGQTTVKLSINQLPPHVHDLTNLSLDASKLTATTNLAAGQASTSLAGITVTAGTTDLWLMANSGSGNAPGASGNALASAPAKVYNGGTPDVKMIAGSISGTIQGSLNGSPTTTLSGTVPTTLSGTVPLTGATAVTGAGGDVPTMPPYVALFYIINLNGIYPTFD